jgi:hypothetical protein
MQPPSSPRERELSGRIYFVREQRDANHEEARNKKSLGGLGGCMAPWRPNKCSK